jgi:hypothetical protein
MRKRPVLVGIVTLTIAVALAVTGIVIGKSKSKNSDSSPQQKVTKSDLPGTVDGNVNPALIADHIAYSLVFRTIALRQGTAFEKARSRAWAKGVGLDEAAADKLIEAANEFGTRVSVLDQQAKQIKDRTWPNPDAATIGQLTALQARKEALVAEIVASLPARVGPETADKFRLHVTEHLKRKMKIAPISANPIGKHH